MMLKDVLNYFRTEALPMAEEQIRASNLAYQVGSIDYIQFIQNLEAAINIKQKFLNQQATYFELSARLKYITGQ